MEHRGSGAEDGTARRGGDPRRADRTGSRVSGRLRHPGRVGIYEVTLADVGLLAWAGSGPPQYPRFPRSHGLNGAAVASRETVVCDDVTRDPRYLTAFGSTRSEIVVPVTDRAGNVVGTLDVESERVAAFGPSDRRTLEACASAAAQLWTTLAGEPS